MQSTGEGHLHPGTKRKASATQRREATDAKRAIDLAGYAGLLLLLLLFVACLVNLFYGGDEMPAIPDRESPILALAPQQVDLSAASRAEMGSLTPVGPAGRVRAAVVHENDANGNVMTYEHD